MDSGLMCFPPGTDKEANGEPELLAASTIILNTPTVRNEVMHCWVTGLGHIWSTAEGKVCMCVVCGKQTTHSTGGIQTASGPETPGKERWQNCTLSLPWTSVICGRINLILLTIFASFFHLFIWRQRHNVLYTSTIDTKNKGMMHD